MSIFHWSLTPSLTALHWYLDKDQPPSADIVFSSVQQNVPLSCAPSPHYLIERSDKFGLCVWMWRGCCQTEPVMHNCWMTEWRLLHTVLGFKVLMPPPRAGRRRGTFQRTRSKTARMSHVSQFQLMGEWKIRIISGSSTINRDSD